MSDESMSGWGVWIVFAAVILVIQGAFGLLIGLVALFNDEVYAVTPNNVWVFDYTAWGWIHIFWSVLAVLAAISLVKGNLPGRIFTVIVASIAALANMAFVPVYPIWSLVMVAVSFLVIWAVIVHGGEIKNSQTIS